ncbi:hypothetical protein B0J13DRAFT_527383 [Dactylonectria estremocensis]|uniref:Sialidase domain-containing protein n=1 Tax=Dactylonectria estremocensis TaxID=1079267 RepID=A0A9P9J1C9_9HYPO|nr:hypothetical protein B0J13DRAFT_527383 [Dactylonectria estremocensis]
MRSLFSIPLLGLLVTGALAIPVDILEETTNSSDSHSIDGDNGELHARARGWVVETWQIEPNRPEVQMIELTRLSALSPSPNCLALSFVTSFTNNPTVRRLYSNHWCEGQNWSPSSYTLGLNGGIASLSTFPGHEEIFFVDKSQLRIRSVRRDGPDKQWGWGLDKQTTPIPPDAGIAAVSLSSTIELFYPGTGWRKGYVMHTYSSDGGSTWNPNQVLSGPDWGGVSTNSLDPIAALSRNGQHQQIFWITALGLLESRYWTPSTGWTRSNIDKAAKANTASSIVTLMRSSSTKEGSNMNFFYVGQDNKIWQGYWKADSPAWKFSKISDDEAFPGAIAAVSMHSQHQEVFWTNRDGILKHAYWTKDQGKWLTETLPGLGDRRCLPGRGLTVVARQGKETIEGWCRLRNDPSKLIHFYYYAF